MRFRGPGAPFHAVVRVPGDKSLSHRALIFAAMANGKSRIVGPGPGADIRSTASTLAALGVSVEDGVVSSPGVRAWRPSSRDLDAGNSATTLRVLAGAVAGRPFTTVFTGDDSLMRRPMRRLVDPLERLGARVTVSADGTPPVRVEGADLVGTEIDIPIPSAQVRTAAALGALQATGRTTITSPPGYRDHTERWLTHLGLGEPGPGETLVVQPGEVPSFEVVIPGDASSASFLWAAAAVQPGATVSTPGVTLNPGRVGVLAVLERMGASVQRDVTGAALGDPVGTVTVTGPDSLAGTTVDGIDAVRALDELPLIAVMAAHATGPTVVSGAAEVRTKESDRIATTVAMIRALGGDAEASPDGFTVGPTRPTGGTVATAGDHRIALAAAVAATTGIDVEVEGFEVAGVSWPGFEAELEAMWSSR